MIVTGDRSALESTEVPREDTTSSVERTLGQETVIRSLK